jgi:hypothetical protein
MVEPLRAAGYLVEAAVEDPEHTVVVAFPAYAGPGEFSICTHTHTHTHIPDIGTSFFRVGYSSTLQELGP